MAFIPKTWRDRDSEFPNRRIITHADSTEEQVLVRRDEGEVRVEGNPFAAANMNNLESRIAAGITSSVTTDTYNTIDTEDKSVIGAINEVAGEKNLAEQYDMAETYSVGDYVIYETVLYKCIVGTTGGFDTDCWERVLVTDEMGHGGGGDSALDDLTDVSIIEPTVGQALVFNGAVWENDDVSGGSSSLAELSDVVISSPSDRQGLVYDAQSGKWINGDSSGFALDKVATGSVVSFNDGADDLPVLDLIAQIEPSLTGYTGVNVTRTGKNLWVDDATKYTKPHDYYICPIALKSGYRYRASARLKSGKTALSGYVVGFVASGDRYSNFTNRQTVITSVGATSSVTVLIDSTWTDPKLIFYMPSGASFTDILDAYELQLELGSDTTEYEPYNGTTYTVTWQTEAGTVHGGYIDLTTGLLTATYGIVVYNGSEADWDNYNSQNGFYRALPEMRIGNWQRGLCDKFDVGTGDASVLGIRLGASNNYIYFNHIKDSIEGVSSLATWKTWLASNNVTVIYPLATPQTYQLTPTEVRTLLGNNTIVADTGNLSVDYQTVQASDIIDLVGEGGASDLADLGDVDLTTPTDGQVLTYDATAEKWVNEDAVGTHVVVEKTVLGSVPVKPSSISTLTVTDAMGTDCVKVKQYLECAQIDAPRYDPPREDLGTIQAVSFAHLRHIHNGTTDTYNTSFSTSFFGGEYDFISGTVKVTLDAMSIQTCTMHNTYPSLFAKAIDSKFVQSISAFIKSSIYTLTKGVLQLNAVKDHEIIIYNGDWNGNTRLWAVWKDTRFTTNSQMTTWLADDHQITLVGLLQTPYYLQATAHAIALDEGENTFESYDMLEFGARIELTYISDDAESIIDEFQAQTGIEDLNDTQILNPSNNQALLYDSTSGTWQNKAVPVPWVEVTGNLSVGSTSITLSDSSIKSNSTIDVYTDPELPHTAISVSTGSVTISFEAQQTIIAVKVRVS